MSGATPTVAEQFRLLVAALALAEERGNVDLGEVATALGTDEGTLTRVVEPVVYLDVRLRSLVAEDGRGPAIILSREFFLAYGVLSISEDHWLRTLASVPPSPETALRLLVAATVLAAELSEPGPDLSSAMVKLEQLVRAAVVVAANPPPSLPVARQANRLGRSLRFRYVKAGHSDVSDREVLAERVYSRWGRWYLYGRPIGSAAADDDTGDDRRAFRIDRIVSAEIGEHEFDRFDPIDAPGYFDLHHLEQSGCVEVSEATLPLLDADYTLDRVEPSSDGRHRVELRVVGDAQLEYLLLRLPPDAVVASPPEWVARRRDAARRVLARYETGP